MPASASTETGDHEAPPPTPGAMVTPAGEGGANRFCCGTKGSLWNRRRPSRRSCTKYQPIFDASPTAGTLSPFTSTSNSEAGLATS